MDSDLLVVFTYLAVPVALLVTTYFTGSYMERQHFASLREREEKYRNLPVTTFETLPEGWRVVSADLVHGSVVISVDYFKRFLAGLRGIFGGRIRSYEPLLDRARREAVLRMTEDAVARGFDAVVNVRLDTSRLASARANGKGTAGVEILAFGTALKLAE